jgi:hypothetical protein
MLKRRYQVTLVCDVEAHDEETAKYLVQQACSAFKSHSYLGEHGMREVRYVHFAQVPRKPAQRGPGKRSIRA